MRSVKWIAVAALCTFIAGCGAKISYTPIRSAPGPMNPRPADSVEVFTTALPNRPYVEVAMMEAQGKSIYANQSGLIAELRKAAGEHGCDGVVMGGSSDRVRGSSGPQGGSVHTIKGYKATCIVFTGATAAASAPPPPAQPPAQACTPNETKLCYGPGACKGAQSCLPDGSGYGPCDCGTAGGQQTPAEGQPEPEGQAAQPGG